MRKRNFNHGSPEQLIDALNDRIVELGGDIEACGKVTAAITTATYRDMDGCFVGKGNTITVGELRKMFNEDHDADPVIGQYEWFQDWLDDSIKNGYLEPVEVNAASDVEASTNINAATGDNPMEDRIADALDDLQEDFDYFAAGVEKLMRSGANAGNEALAIIENCRNAINEYIAQIAQTVEGL